MEEGAGRRGIPSLLKSPVVAETEATSLSLQQEHIASDITQVMPSYLVSLSWHRLLSSDFSLFFSSFFAIFLWKVCFHSM